MRVAAADVGGTKTLVALYEGTPPDDWRELRRTRYASADYPGLAPILQDFLGDEATSVEAIGVGVAGPVIDDTSKATNLPWEIDARVIEQQCGVAHARLLNDFAAIALGVGQLPDKDLACLQDGEVEDDGVVAIIGAGTGLGEAIVVPTGGSLPRVVASEGGHSDFAARNEEEIGLLRFLLARHRGRVSFERVLSGKGLQALYEHVVEAGLAETSQSLTARFEREDPAAVISDAALAGKDPAAEKALRWFCSLYGAEAGNLALKVLPFGGLYVSGGIAPKILDALRGPEFLEAFTTKGRMSPLLERMRVSVVLDASVGLLGARRAASALLA
ncbi:MAG: glucokinase [Sandaracinaceae bacterium]